ncbi:DeoR/GlpR family DNA-binding transcription regulator [Hoeflea prorocentri]|uniref:DeoR/GlpR family DNA-binding transcription regulator n=1 Tax=Hoeflea prorocentri TaxID=1922333 RepID=A0A9X3UMR4_9HYPH|nr:DeoR/GlpR family DNA-binding transcription regulator [Hoeflea prorocentri]MCY6381921.1 DeoR/GlpR family DNA-binding transcription regulator [Hoeflea prorocentri]MDA5399721.1 DeoR/GlpR family DNA-binding transcription regulator [Hoeflea prorocentri]
MTLKTRHEDILDTVNRHGRVSVEQLATLFDVSAETIRRDLTFLNGAGRLQKVHGGAKRARLFTEASFEERMGEEADGKMLIARKLTDMIEPGDTIFIDTGSTTLACAAALAEKGPLTVITNSIHIALTFDRAHNGSSVFLLGGQFSAGNGQTLGTMAVEQIGSFQADHAILTVAALNAETGAMDANFDEAQIALAMRRNARDTVIVATTAKVGRTATYRLCMLDEIDVLVSDRAPDEAFATALSKAGVEVR